jgi:hypothetical protein
VTDSTVPTPETFVLERTENPHPVMLAGALKARQAMRDSNRSNSVEHQFWLGYLTAMADATGCEWDDLEAWMDRMEAKA